MWSTEQQISDNLLFETPVVNTDAAIVLGARSVSGTIARETARMYHEGRFKKIFVSGGLRVCEPAVYFTLLATEHRANLPAMRECLSLQREADQIVDILKAQSVPESAIISTDRNSKNTAENFRFIKGALSGIHSATVVTYAPHQRRAIGTAAIELGDESPILVPHPVYPFGFNRENWGESVIAPLVRGEAAKVDPGNTDPKTSYIIKGFCRDVTPEDVLKRAASLSL